MGGLDKSALWRWNSVDGARSFAAGRSLGGPCLRLVGWRLGSQARIRISLDLYVRPIRPCRSEGCERHRWFRSSIAFLARDTRASEREGDCSEIQGCVCQPKRVAAQQAHARGVRGRTRVMRGVGRQDSRNGCKRGLPVGVSGNREAHAELRQPGSGCAVHGRSRRRRTAASRGVFDTASSTAGWSWH